MKKELQIQTNENLHDYIERLAEALHMTHEQKEAVVEVSKQSYFKGSNAAFETLEATLNTRRNG